VTGTFQVPVTWGLKNLEQSPSVLVTKMMTALWLSLPPLSHTRAGKKDHSCAAFLDWRFGSPFCWTIADPF